ncbi:hypothetical protein GBF38_005387 [Nibea albiflora]|uniref:Uncharacterized protein n=1 Tax=Nibea albiflora TaxID=240163 RepID=A0ACB7EWX4_NIBAL|nr:hypothetical protein GBF38_005387 [Nibea albiflora]
MTLCYVTGSKTLVTSCCEPRDVSGVTGKRDNPPLASTTRSPPSERDDKEQSSQGSRPEACQRGAPGPAEEGSPAGCPPG